MNLCCNTPFPVGKAQHLVRHLAEQVEDLPNLQRELRCLKVRVEALEERCKAAMEANDSLLAVRERWAEKGRLYE